MTIVEHAERYIALKRRLGVKYEGADGILLGYARYTDACGDRSIGSGRMVEWSSQASTVDSARRRLELLRNFAIWLHAEDDRHEVPAKNILGPRQKTRPKPHLLTWEQIGLVMEAAFALPPAGSITPLTIHFMIGLVAATGLRASEAAALRLSDLTADGLVIRETKFRKTRLVALHPSVRNALDEYLEIRNDMAEPGEYLFVISTGGPTSGQYLSCIFTRLARKVGIKGGPGKAGPSLHSLRHSFAVRSLEAFESADPVKVSRHMAALSTYLGHAHISSTYWYLEGTPALLQSIAVATENARWRRAAR